MIKLSFPFTEEKIRALKVGDGDLIAVVVFTGRDVVHKYLREGGPLRLASFSATFSVFALKCSPV
jgi:tartrate dehydratase beta subunit/fumarate hydratase class I family protein